MKLIIYFLMFTITLQCNLFKSPGEKLLVAIEAGDIEEVKKNLPSNSSSFYSKEKINYDYMVTAIEKNNLEIVKILVEAGYPIDLATPKLGPMIYIAHQYERKDIIEYFIEKGAKVLEEKRGYSFFIHCLRKGDFETAKYVAKNSKDFNNKHLLKNALKICAEDGLLDGIKILVQEKKVSIDTYVDKSYSIDQTILDIAVKSNQIEVVKYLLEKGAKEGNVIFEIYKNNQSEILDILISKGININQKDEGGNSILLSSSPYCSDKLLEKIIPLVENINETYNDGQTAMFNIGKHANGIEGESCSNTIKLLIEAGIDLDKKDNDGKTALEYIKENYSSFDYEVINEAISKYRK